MTDMHTHTERRENMSECALRSAHTETMLWPAQCTECTRSIEKIILFAFTIFECLSSTLPKPCVRQNKLTIPEMCMCVCLNVYTSLCRNMVIEIQTYSDAIFIS